MYKCRMLVCIVYGASSNLLLYGTHFYYSWLLRRRRLGQRYQILVGIIIGASSNWVVYPMHLVASG